MRNEYKMCTIAYVLFDLNQALDSRAKLVVDINALVHLNTITFPEVSARIFSLIWSNGPLKSYRYILTYSTDITNAISVMSTKLLEIQIL